MVTLIPLESLWFHFAQELTTEQLHFAQVEGGGKKPYYNLPSFHAKLRRLSWSSPWPSWSWRVTSWFPSPPKYKPYKTAMMLKKPELWKDSSRWLTVKLTHSSLIGRHLKIQSYLISLPEIPPLESISPKVMSVQLAVMPAPVTSTRQNSLLLRTH